MAVSKRKNDVLLHIIDRFTLPPHSKERVSCELAWYNDKLSCERRHLRPLENADAVRRLDVMLYLSTFPVSPFCPAWTEGKGAEAPGGLRKSHAVVTPEPETVVQSPTTTYGEPVMQ